MIEPVLDLLQVHREVVFRHAPVVIQNVFGVAPEPFDAVDMVRADPTNLNNLLSGFSAHSRHDELGRQ